MRSDIIPSRSPDLPFVGSERWKMDGRRIAFCEVPSVRDERLFVRVKERGSCFGRCRASISAVIFPLPPSLASTPPYRELIAPPALCLSSLVGESEEGTGAGGREGVRVAAPSSHSASSPICEGNLKGPRTWQASPASSQSIVSD